MNGPTPETESGEERECRKAVLRELRELAMHAIAGNLAALAVAAVIRHPDGSDSMAVKVRYRPSTEMGQIDRLIGGLTMLLNQTAHNQVERYHAAEAEAEANDEGLN